MTKKIYFEALKSVLGCSILHYWLQILESNVHSTFHFFIQNQTVTCQKLLIEC